MIVSDYSLFTIIPPFLATMAQRAPGLTFEVYDRIEGVPSIGDLDPETGEALLTALGAIMNL
jgi:hypothetical protein